MKTEFEKIGILPKGNNTQQKVKCPNCYKIGKEHYNDPCLSINLDSGVFNCHKCSWHGKVKTEYYMPEKKVYQKPVKNNLKKLNLKCKKFLTKRGITEEVIEANKIISTKDGNSIVFPYFKNNELINYKTRGINNKIFTQSRNGLPIIYNYDRVANEKLIIICEGEIDSLSWEVAGITWHTSVNMGAPNVHDKNIDKKLECISNSYEVFEQAERIYIATDEDDNGRYLCEELVRRFGAEKCKIVSFKPYKDANEVLQNEGVESLKDRVRNAIDPKVEGIFGIDDIFDSMLDNYRNGQERGTTTYIPSVDSAWTWRNGELNIWTGYQNEGKKYVFKSVGIIKSIF